MTLSYVTLVLDLFDGSGNQISQGAATFTPSAQLTDVTDRQDIPQAPVQGYFRAGLAAPQVTLLATDNANVTPSGWGWNVSFQNVPGNPASFSFELPYANGATQYLSSVQVVLNPTTMQAYMPLSGGAFTGAADPAVVMLTDASSIAVNALLGNDFRLTLTGNHTLANPSNPVDGQKIALQVTQGTGGSFTLSYGSAYEFSTGLPQPVLSTTAGATDLLGFIYNAAKSKWLFAAFVNGYS